MPFLPPDCFFVGSVTILAPPTQCLILLTPSRYKRLNLLGVSDITTPSILTFFINNNNKIHSFKLSIFIQVDIITKYGLSEMNNQTLPTMVMLLHGIKREKQRLVCLTKLSIAAASLALSRNRNTKTQFKTFHQHFDFAQKVF